MIRIATVAHGSPEYDATVSLRRRVLRLPLGLDFTLEELSAEADQIHLATLLGEDLVACGVYVPASPWAKVRQVAVEPAYVGCGYGREIMLRTEVLARDDGREGILLHARETAIGFYERLGYNPEGPPFTEVGIPHRLMRKKL